MKDREWIIIVIVLVAVILFLLLNRNIDLAPKPISVGSSGFGDYLRSCDYVNKASIWNNGPDIISGDSICPKNTECVLAHRTTYLMNEFPNAGLEADLVGCDQQGASAGPSMYYGVSAVCCSS